MHSRSNKKNEPICEKKINHPNCNGKHKPSLIGNALSSNFITSASQ